MGFSVERQDFDKGLIYAVAQAPTPLTKEEWEKARELDEPNMRKIAAIYMPVSSLFMGMHIDGVEIHAIVSVVSTRTGARISLSYKIVDHKMLDMGFVANESPPPNAARIGIMKAWGLLEERMQRIQEKDDVKT